MLNRSVFYSNKKRNSLSSVSLPTIYGAGAAAQWCRASSADGYVARRTVG